MGATLDLTKAHLRRTHGDIDAVYSWLNDERALFLIPRMRKNPTWFIIMEKNAHEYTNDAVLMAAGIKAMLLWDMEPTKQNAFRVAKIIDEGLADLIRMPAAPEPEYVKAAFGEMHMRADGETIKSDVISVEKPMLEFEASNA